MRSLRRIPIAAAIAALAALIFVTAASAQTSPPGTTVVTSGSAASASATSASSSSAVVVFNPTINVIQSQSQLQGQQQTSNNTNTLSNTNNVGIAIANEAVSFGGPTEAAQPQQVIVHVIIEREQPAATAIPLICPPSERTPICGYPDTPQVQVVYIHDAPACDCNVEEPVAAPTEEEDCPSDNMSYGDQ
jgi:hypothetical protein